MVVYQSVCFFVASIKCFSWLIDFQTLSTKFSKRKLDGAEVTLEQIEQSDSVLVENLHPGTTADLLTLYFESERGGRQTVKEVTVLAEGTAKVSFANHECKFCTVQPLPQLLLCLRLRMKQNVSFYIFFFK